MAEGHADSVEVCSGVNVETRELSWKIKNFAGIVKNGSLINAQWFEFLAGKTVGLSSKWRVFLYAEDPDANYVGAFFKLVEASHHAHANLLAECSFSIGGGNGNGGAQVPAVTCSTDTFNMAFEGRGQGESRFIRKSTVDDKLVNGTLTIRVVLKIYSSPAQPTVCETVPELLQNFNKISSAKAWEDLEGLLQSQMNYNEVKIIANDGRQFTAKKEVLVARSPVFEAMLVRCDMKEKATEKVELPDMSGPTVSVLIHFFYTGKLLPEWRESEVILELTNAAAKYQLPELLAFLDSALGKVCESGNALELLSLADKLELRKAEADLMEYMRREGLVSKEKLFQILKADADAQPQANEE